MRWLSLSRLDVCMLLVSSSRVGGAFLMFRFLNPRLELAVALAPPLLFKKLVYIDWLIDGRLLIVCLIFNYISPSQYARLPASPLTGYYKLLGVISFRLLICWVFWKLLYLNKMKFSDLIEHCVTCIKSFNPVIKTIDSHADEFINNVSTRRSKEETILDSS